MFIFKYIKRLVYLLIAAVILLIIIITVAIAKNHYDNINVCKRRYPHAIELINNKYDNQIYLSCYRNNGGDDIEFSVKSAFEKNYNFEGVSKKEFYSQIGYDMFNCFQEEIQAYIAYDTENGFNYFQWPVYITITYDKAKNEKVTLELYDKDWSNFEVSSYSFEDE